MSQIASTGTPEVPTQSGGPAIGFTVHFAPKTDALGVEYKIKNTRDKPIYIFNVIWAFGPKGQYVPAPMPVYACLRQGNVLHLAKMILPLPKSGAVELRIVPFATKVEAGQVFEEKFELPLPLNEYNPYYPERPDSKYKVMQSQSAIFTLQFVNEVPDMKTPTAPLPNAIHLQHPRLLGLVETVKSNPEPVQVRVNKRLDRFEEF
jgi:hypothetical protein